MLLNCLRTALFTAVGYWLFGLAANIFAIPPGFASPIWPAAGLAYFMTVLFGRGALAGVFTASFLLNLKFADATIFSPSAAWIPALGIACGAVTQAAMAHFLIHKFTRYPELASRTSDAILLGILGGPLACICSASIGIFSLWSAGILSSTDVAINWLHWWIGDSIGVIIFAPILLSLNIKKHRPQANKFFGFFVIYLLLVALASAIFLYAKQKEFTSNEIFFQEKSNGFAHAIEKQLNATIQISQSLVAVFETFGDVNVDNFYSYTRSLYKSISAIHALSWIPVVHSGDRVKMEENLKRIYGDQFYFFEKDSYGVRVPAPNKERYYPVYYIYPTEGNRAAIGFDLSSHFGRKQALDAATRLLTPAATQPISLVQGTKEQTAFLLFSPIIDQHNGITGFVSSVFRIHDLVSDSLGETALHNYVININDVTDGVDQPLMVDKRVGSIFMFEQHLEFAQRKWRIVIEPTLEMVSRYQSWWVWFILISSFFFVTLVGLFLLLILSRTAAIQNEVRIKTLALKDALDQAERSSGVKSAFLASMSHELRTPLNSIIGFSVRLQKGLRGKIDDRYLDSIDTIARNGQHLLTLINDILDLSKVEAGKMTINRTRVNVDSAITDIIKAFSPQAETKQLELIADSSPVAEMSLDRQRFIQILTNLVGNAIKFTSTGSVRICFELSKHQNIDGLLIEVQDTGQGISEQDLSRLFLRYEQLGDTFQGGQIGTGLGLALVQELATLHGGHVRVSSQLGKGSSFYVWLPIDVSALPSE